MLIDAALIAANLAVLGAHAVLPWLAAGTRPAWRRPWALAAAPLLLAGAVATLSHVGAAPDAAVAQGLTIQSGGPLVRMLAIAGLALLAADLLIAFAWPRLEPAAWRVVGSLGVLLLPLAALAAERLRIGEGPPVGAAALAIGLLVRLALALATTELLTGPRLAAPAAGLTLPLLWPALAPAIRATLAAEGTLVTLGVAALALLLARWAPRRLRRLSLGVGLLLAVLFLARAAAVPAELPQRTPPLAPLGLR